MEVPSFSVYITDSKIWFSVSLSVLTLSSQIRGHVNVLADIFRPFLHGLNIKKGSQLKRKPCWCFLESTDHPVVPRCSQVQNASEAPLQVYLEWIQLWHKALLWTLIMVASKAWTIFLSIGFTNSQLQAY